MVILGGWVFFMGEVPLYAIDVGRSLSSEYFDWKRKADTEF